MIHVWFALECSCLLLNVYATDGHHIITISAMINGTNEKKYSFTTRRNVASSIVPNKKLSENTFASASDDKRMIIWEGE